MDIQFDGFQNSIPTVGLTLLVFLLIGLSIWTYLKTKELSPFFKVLLSSLRTLAFLLLLFLLLNPVFTINEEVYRPFHLTFLFDTSQSTSIEKGDYDGLDTYHQVIRDILPDKTDDRFQHVIVTSYGFDSELNPLDSPLESAFSGSRTNIHKTLTDFLDLYDDQRAVVMVSDGIVTTGRNPASTASHLPVPLYTIGIGDTSRINDVVVQNVSNQPVASVNSQITVTTTIVIDGFPEQDIPVQLMQDGTILDETMIRTSEDRSAQQVRFSLDLEEEGLKQYQIHVPPLPGEWTERNNTRAFTVDVRDDRLRILHLAYEIHPDVRHVRTFLELDKQISLEKRTWLRDDVYIDGELPDRPDTLDLVILHGFPHSDLSSGHAAMVLDRFSSNPLFVIGSPGQDVSRVSTLFPGVSPIQFNANYRWFDIQADVPSRRDIHPILDFPVSDQLTLPPIRGGIQGVSLSGNSLALLKTTYRRNSTDAPLLAIRTIGNRNISWLNGYHFYHWALGRNSDAVVFWGNLLNNTVKWTASSPDDRQLDLYPVEPIFEPSDPVVFLAFLRTPSGEPKANGRVEITITDEAGESRNYLMRNEGDGQYQLEMDPLPEGRYEFNGAAFRGEREIETTQGTFSVGGINLEFIHTQRNDALLEEMAVVSGGRFLPHNQAIQLLDLIDDDIGFDEHVDIVSTSFSLHRHPGWFIVILCLLTIEWIIRKYKAMA